MANDFNLGRHEALIERLVIGQEQLVDRVTEIERILSEKRGERRVSLWALSAFSAVLGGTMSLVVRFLRA
jgi:hypothetical protein